MGIIKAAINAIGGGFADQWLETVEPANMGDSVCFTPGIVVSKNNGRGSNTKGSSNLISNGSIIHVYDNQFMMLIDGGKVVDYTAEPGYYKVDNSSAPSLFNGQFKDSLFDAFNRVKFGGMTPQAQYVCYINLQEIKGITFGTPNPVNYFDAFYNSELFIRAHGSYTIKVTNPILFYEQVIPKEAVTAQRTIDFNELNKKQYLGEFLTAMSSALNQMSADGIRISYVSSKARELGSYMAKTLDDEWSAQRGMEIQAVSIQVSYDDESQKLINMRNKGAMLSDAAVQQGYVAANISEGLKDAGSNSNGAMQGFMGMGIGMQAGSNILGGYQQNGGNYANNQQQSPAPAAPAAPAASWTCACSQVNSGNFCSACGAKKPEPTAAKFCSNCGAKLNADAKFCSECGTKL